MGYYEICGLGPLLACHAVENNKLCETPFEMGTAKPGFSGGSRFI